MDRFERAGFNAQMRRDRMAGPSPMIAFANAIKGANVKERQMPSRTQYPYAYNNRWSHNPWTGQPMTLMPFDLGSAIGNAQARAYPLQALNASSVPARAAANATMYGANANVRMAQIQANAMIEQQRMKNQTLAALLRAFSARMGGGGFGGFGGITTNYGAGVSPTPVTNYK